MRSGRTTQKNRAKIRPIWAAVRWLQIMMRA